MSRKSRRELETDLAELTERDYDDLDILTLVEFLSYGIETVDENAGVVRLVETGELRRRDPAAGRSIEEVIDAHCEGGARDT